MDFARVFAASTVFGAPDKLDAVRKHIDPVWVEAALAATGTATVRRRRLPAEQVIWVVLGMALFRDRSIEDVVSKLDLALPGAGSIARSSVAQARERLGSEPLEWLFNRTAAHWARKSAAAATWRGLELYGIDGTTVRVPDTKENREAFGDQTGRNDTHSAYPMVRLAVLMALRAHLLVAASFGSYSDTHELDHARPLLDSIPACSLTILDRAYVAHAFLCSIARGTERHWIVRAKSNTRTRTIAKLGRGDELVELEAPAQQRVDPSLPAKYQARLITYKRRGFPEVRLLTSLVDAKRYPSAEIVALYHERWELELGYDELKTELLDREEAIRSKKPEGVKQELWGILLAYNLVRLEMAHVAREAKVDPTRISFVESLRLIRDEWMWLAVTSPGAIPKRLANLRRNLKRYILPPRRTKRRYPRAVKIKMSNFPRKKPAVELAK